MDKKQFEIIMFTIKQLPGHWTRDSSYFFLHDVDILEKKKKKLESGTISVPVGSTSGSQRLTSFFQHQGDDAVTFNYRRGSFSDPTLKLTWIQRFKLKRALRKWMKFHDSCAFDMGMKLEPFKKYIQSDEYKKKAEDLINGD